MQTYNHDQEPVIRTLSESLPDPLIDASGAASFVSGATGTTYYGYSNWGVGVTQPYWKIKKVVNDGSGNITTTYAQNPSGENNNLYTNIWNNRASLNYSR